MTNNLHRAPILILIQTLENTIHPVAVKVIETACSLGIKDERAVYGVLFCKALSCGLQSRLKQTGLAEVFVYQNASLDSFIPEIYVDLIEECVDNLKPNVVLACATPEGRAVSSILAARLKTGVTADCTALCFNSQGQLLQTRPAYGGNIMAEIITLTARPQIATLRFGAEQKGFSTITTKITIKDVKPKRILPKEYFVEWKDKTGVAETAEADIIIALGGGVHQKSDIALFAEIAQKFNAKLMCSRALVERGWLARNDQIGLSGQSVSPKLLITLGVSGSLQFLAGIQDVKRLCCVSLDKDAPILKVADCPIVGDMYDIIVELNHALSLNVK